MFVSSEQSSSFNSAELKLNTPPDLSPSGPVALVATATSKTSQQPADGDGARTTEVEHRKEGEGAGRGGQRSPLHRLMFVSLTDGEQRPWRSRRHLVSPSRRLAKADANANLCDSLLSQESYKPLSAPPARTSDRSASYAGEKR